MASSTEARRNRKSVTSSPTTDVGSIVNMRAGACKLANQFLSGVVNQETAGAFKTLLHEALHRQGIRTERTTEALAIATMYDAGQLLEYNRLVGEHDNSPTWDTWESAFGWGADAARLSWQQSQRYVARSYRTAWPRIDWFYRNLNWADVLDAGLAGD